MATRLSFRPRPLDLHKQMPVVRDVQELDTADGLVSRDISHDHEALDRNNEEAKMVQNAKAKGGKEIPIPKVSVVPTYKRDYLPKFKERATYIRGRGGVGWQSDDLVEYDLDSEDEAWLAEYNSGQEDRLPVRRFELTIWRLETANAEYTDRALSAAGASSAERMSTAACASIEHMSQAEAATAMERDGPLRYPVREAVYAYWLAKRKRLGKPLLRRLQAPTSISDTNPFNVFRPRERIHRPQTRRRRENNEDSLDKMRAIRANLAKASEVMEWLTRREKKKRDLVYVEVDLQQLQIKLRHEPRCAHEAIEAEYAAAAKGKPGRRPIDLDAQPRPALAEQQANGFAGPGSPSDAGRKQNKKRRRDGRRAGGPAGIAALLPSPPPLPEDMLFALTPSLPAIAAASHASPSSPAGPSTLAPSRHASASGDAALGRSAASGPSSPDGALHLPPGVDLQRVRPRVGRAGRLVLDRCCPWTLQQLATDAAEDTSTAKPMHELPNPFQLDARPLAPPPPSGPAASGNPSLAANATSALGGPGRQRSNVVPAEASTAGGDPAAAAAPAAAPDGGTPEGLQPVGRPPKAPGQVAMLPAAGEPKASASGLPAHDSAAAGEAAHPAALTAGEPHGQPSNGLAASQPGRKGSGGRGEGRGGGAGMLKRGPGRPPKLAKGGTGVQNGVF